MTIPEQLHLDVLTAPVAAVDRRALSQAWYSALYASSGGATPAPAKPSRATPPRALALTRPAQAIAQKAAPANRTAPSRGEPDTSPRGAGTGIERRAVRSRLAETIARTLLRADTRVRSASFTVGAKRERVHVMLHGSGARLRLVALCARASYAAVSQALMQARFALAERGIALETKLVERDAR